MHFILILIRLVCFLKDETTRIVWGFLVHSSRIYGLDPFCARKKESSVGRDCGVLCSRHFNQTFAAFFVYNLGMCYVHEPLRQFETQDLSMAQSDSCKHAQELVESVLHQ